MRPFRVEARRECPGGTVTAPYPTGKVPSVQGGCPDQLLLETQTPGPCEPTVSTPPGPSSALRPPSAIESLEKSHLLEVPEVELLLYPWEVRPVLLRAGR